MKKKEIKPTTTSDRKPLSKEMAENYALRTAGSHFTAAFIANPKNGLSKDHKEKIKDFRDDAEECFTKVTAWAHSRRIVCLWVMLTLTLTAVVAYRCYRYDWISLLYNWASPTCLILAILSACIGLIYGGSTMGAWNRPGNTARIVARAWRPIRKKIIASGVIDEMSSTIRYHHDNDQIPSVFCSALANWQFTGKELAAVLERAMDDLSRKAALRVRVAERDGVESVKSHFRYQFGLIDSVGQALGYEGLVWDQLNSTVNLLDFY